MVILPRHCRACHFRIEEVTPFFVRRRPKADGAPKGEPTMHKFHLGQTVSYHVPRGIDAPRGAYVLMAKLPERDGEFEYRILSALEGHHRTARESELQPRSEVEAAPVEKVNRRPGGTASVDFTRLHFQHSRDMFAGYLVKRWWEDQRMRRRAIIILVLMAATM